MTYMQKIESVCVEEKGRVEAELLLGLDLMESGKIKHIEEFDLFSVSVRQDQKGKCVEKLVEGKFDDERLAEMKGREWKEDEGKMGEKEIESKLEEMQKTPTQLSLWAESSQNAHKSDPHSYFFYRLSLDPDNPPFKLAETHHYN